jgi:hypothetical protein
MLAAASISANNAIGGTDVSYADRAAANSAMRTWICWIVLSERINVTLTATICRIPWTILTCCLDQATLYSPAMTPNFTHQCYATDPTPRPTPAVPAFHLFRPATNTVMMTLSYLIFQRCTQIFTNRHLQGLSFPSGTHSFTQEHLVTSQNCLRTIARLKLNLKSCPRVFQVSHPPRLSLLMVPLTLATKSFLQLLRY